MVIMVILVKMVIMVKAGMVENGLFSLNYGRIMAKLYITVMLDVVLPFFFAFQWYKTK